MYIREERCRSPPVGDMINVNGKEDDYMMCQGCIVYCSVCGEITEAPMLLCRLVHHESLAREIM